MWLLKTGGDPLIKGPHEQALFCLFKTSYEEFDGRNKLNTILQFIVFLNLFTYCHP